MRKPDNYDELKKAALERKNAVLEQKPANENADTPPASGKDNAKKPNTNKAELSIKPGLLRQLIRLFQAAPVLEQTPISGAITPNCCGNRHTTVKLASFVADAVFQIQKTGLIQRAWDAKGNLNFDAALFNYTAKTLTSGFINGWRTQPVKLVDLGFEYGTDDPVSLTAYEMNLFRFAGVKTLYEAQQLNELFRKTKSFKEFYDTASSMLEVHNRDWLETEYNTAMAVGESAATYSRLLKQTDTFPYWEYKTVGDNKVRHSHQLLNGIILPFTHPAWQFILPPNDWNCRCYIVPRTKAEVTDEQIKESEAKAKTYTSSPAFKKAAKGGWGINRADKKMVFTENQHYTTDYLDAMQKLSEINFKNFDLQPINQINKGEAFKPAFNQTQKDEAIADFFAPLEKVSTKKSALVDFNNRKVLVSKSTVASHTNQFKDKYADRHMYLELLPEVLKNPDEVWLHSYGSPLDNYVYIKYYKGTALAVVTRLKDALTLEIETWYPLDDNTLRSGLLIKN